MSSLSVKGPSNRLHVHIVVTRRDILSPNEFKLDRKTNLLTGFIIPLSQCVSVCVEETTFPQWAEGRTWILLARRCDPDCRLVSTSSVDERHTLNPCSPLTSSPPRHQLTPARKPRRPWLWRSSRTYGSRYENVCTQTARILPPL